MTTETERAQVIAEARQMASLPGSRWAAKGAGLSAGELGLAWAIVQAFPWYGGPPDLAWVQATACDLGLEPAAALATLEAHDLLVLDPAGGAITAAYPFSGVPTAHRVAIAGALPVYANCAIDALGVPFMLGRDATVLSVDPVGGEPVRVDFRGGEAHWDPATAVVLSPTDDVANIEGSALATRCPAINFFVSAASAAAYQETHPEHVWHLLTPAAAIEAGRRAFGSPGGQPWAEAEAACPHACCQS